MPVGSGPSPASDTTRLNFLVDALVSAPRMADQLTKNVLDAAPSPWLRACTVDLRDAFRATFENGARISSSDGLSAVVRRLEDNNNRRSSQVAAAALASAIQSAASSLSR